jgi:hypothetical protein
MMQSRFAMAVRMRILKLSLSAVYAHLLYRTIRMSRHAG